MSDFVAVLEVWNQPYYGYLLRPRLEGNLKSEDAALADETTEDQDRKAAKGGPCRAWPFKRDIDRAPCKGR